MRMAHYGAAPVPDGRVANRLRVLGVDALETRQERHGVRAEPDERQRAQHPADAQEVMVAARQPQGASLVIVGTPYDFDRIAADREVEAVELQHELDRLQQRLAKRGVACERSDILLRQQWRGLVGAAGFRQRKEPLNVIVGELELVEVELVDVAQRAAAVVAPATSIERDKGAVTSHYPLRSMTLAVV